MGIFYNKFVSGINNKVGFISGFEGNVVEVMIYYYVLKIGFNFGLDCIVVGDIVNVFVVLSGNEDGINGYG